MFRSIEGYNLIVSFICPPLEFARPHRLALTVGIFFTVAETGASLAVP